MTPEEKIEHMLNEYGMSRILMLVIEQLTATEQAYIARGMPADSSTETLVVGLESVLRRYHARYSALPGRCTEEDKGYGHPAMDGRMIDPSKLDLVQLSTLPEELWFGRTVFSPHAQAGTNAFWRGVEDPNHMFYDEMYAGQLMYDLGMVAGWWEEQGDTRVRFTSCCAGESWSLQYSAQCLWTPRP